MEPERRSKLRKKLSKIHTKKRSKNRGFAYPSTGYLWGARGITNQQDKLTEEEKLTEENQSTER